MKKENIVKFILLVIWILIGGRMWYYGQLCGTLYYAGSLAYGIIWMPKGQE